MAYTRDWDETQPQDHLSFSNIPVRIRQVKTDVAERLKNFFYGFISGETQEGAKKITFREQPSDPATESDCAIIYAKEVSGVTEIFVKDSSGNIKQITSNGKLNVGSDEAVLLTGDQTIEGTKTFKDDQVVIGDSSISTDVNIDVINSAGQGQIRYSSGGWFGLRNGGAGAHHLTIDSSGNVSFTGNTTISGDATINGNATVQQTLSLKTFSASTNGYTYLPNGFILQWGLTGDIAGDNGVNVTFPITFPNACLQVVACHDRDRQGNDTYPDDAILVGSITASGCRIANADAQYVSRARWLAIGY